MPALHVGGFHPPQLLEVDYIDHALAEEGFTFIICQLVFVKVEPPGLVLVSGIGVGEQQFVGSELPDMEGGKHGILHSRNYHMPNPLHHHTFVLPTACRLLKVVQHEVEVGLQVISAKDKQRFVVPLLRIFSILLLVVDFSLMDDMRRFVIEAKVVYFEVVYSLIFPLKILNRDVLGLLHTY